MFDEFMSVLRTMANLSEKDFIKSIPRHLVEEYNMVKIYIFLVLSRDFNDFEGRYYKVRESAIRYKQDTIKDNLDIIYALAMSFKGGD